MSREYDPAINEGHNVSSGIPNGEMGMSRDCFEEYLCSNTGKPISLCGCHHPNMGYNAEMKNRDGRLLQTLCLPEPGRYARYLGHHAEILSFLYRIFNMQILQSIRIFSWKS